MISRPRPTGRDALWHPVRPLAAAALALSILFLGGGCDRAPTDILVPNQRPQIRLTAAPQPSSEVRYTVELQWSGFDSDGRIVRYEYALDPPAGGDTVWTATGAHETTLSLQSTEPSDPLPPAGQPVRARDVHTFALRAVDDQGACSAVVQRSFTSRTVAPETLIEAPRPNNQQPIFTLPSVVIRWNGTDPDGVASPEPLLYKYRIVPASTIQPDAPEAITSFEIQEYFGRDFENGFADWDSVTGDVTSHLFEGLSPQTRYYFAVTARDEAGAFEPRFLLTSNVLQFRPVLANLGPRLTLTNEFFSRTQMAGGVSLDPSRIFHLEVPEGVALTFNWSADPHTGTTIAGYRWALDLEGQDITNESSRIDDDDVHHWSVWSVAETRATIGPFDGSPDSTTVHYLYVEVRDDVGFVTLFTLRLEVVVPAFDRELLVIDDMFGSLSYSPQLPYPTEAEQDTFHFARGGVRDWLVGGNSVPGAFADFAYDTLDYRSFGIPGMSLSRLGRYKVVAWYTDNSSSSGSADLPYSSQNKPSSALRYINTVGRLNTLGVYLRQGGKLFLFGEGATPSIANGFWTRVSGGGVPFVPYGSNPGEVRSYVLRPGCFLHDFLHFRSRMNTAGTPSVQFTLGEQLAAAIPYLPEFRGPATDSVRTYDPRIGPGAERTATRFAGLPRLTLRTYRGAMADPFRRSINQTWYVDTPLHVTEGPGAVSVLDTLYLVQARNYSGDGNGALSDAHPNGLYYHGSEHGEIVWFGFPLYYFEHEEARAAVRTVLTVLGVEPRPGAAASGAHAAR